MTLTIETKGNEDLELDDGDDIGAEVRAWLRTERPDDDPDDYCLLVSGCDELPISAYDGLLVEDEEQDYLILTYSPDEEYIDRPTPSARRKKMKTLQNVIDEIGGASEIHGTTNLAAECLTQSAELIASRGGFDVYALECGDWFLSANDGSTHLVIADDLDDYDSEAARVVGAVTDLTGDMLDVVFDNGGGITVQARGFVHSYDDSTQAAHAVKEILAADYDPSQWEGDEPNSYQGFIANPEIERNGGYKWLGRQDITEVIKAGELDDCWGHAMADFFTALGVKITDENYAR